MALSPVGYVYRITNKVNGKTYIGRHFIKNEPWRQYLGSGRAIKLAVRQYGRDLFVKTFVIWAFSREELFDLEREHIGLEKSIGHGEYNLTLSSGEENVFFNYSTPLNPDKLAELLSEGLSLYEIGVQLGCSDHWVSCEAERYGLRARKKARTYENSKEILPDALLRELYVEQSWPFVLILHEYQVSAKHLQRMLEEYRIPRRSTSEITRTNHQTRMRDSGGERPWTTSEKLTRTILELHDEGESISGIGKRLKEKLGKGISHGEIRTTLENLGKENLANLSQSMKKNKNALGKPMGGLTASHNRWHKNRNVVNVNCQLCLSAPHA